jgi:hypothetical protein
MDTGDLNASTSTNSMKLNASFIQFDDSPLSTYIEPSRIKIGSNMNSVQLSEQGITLGEQNVSWISLSTVNYIKGPTGTT